MPKNRYYEIDFSRVKPTDSIILEKWYGMTDYFGYATGYKSFEEIRKRLEDCENSRDLAAMVSLTGREKAVGFILCEMKDLHHTKVLWINIIIVDPEFQGCGLGTCVVNKMVQYAGVKCGATVAMASVSEKNRQGLSFFQKLGFTRCNSLEQSLSTFGPAGVAIMKRLIR